MTSIPDDNPTERRLMIEHNGRTYSVVCVNQEVVQALLPACIDQVNSNNSSLVMGESVTQPQAALISFAEYLNWRQYKELSANTPL